MSGTERERRESRESREGREGREGRGGGIGGIGRIVVGGLLVAASIVAMGALTRYDYRAGTDAAELRLAWRLPVPRTVECREPTQAELEELPVHMRQDEICEGRTARYRLEVRVDGELVHRSAEEAAGARGDRPVHVFEELPLDPGEREVRVVFERAGGSGEAGEPGAGEAAAGVPGAGDSVGDPGAPPSRLVLDRRLEVGVRDVLLVTYDRDEGRLVLRHRSGG